MSIKLLLICTVLIILIVIVTIKQKGYIETFNNLASRVALYDHPYECPFDYINLSEDLSKNDKFIVESKLKKQPKELDHVYDTIDEYLDAWKQISSIFPNIKKCGDPYQQYLEQLRIYYQNQKNTPNTHDTTTPIYVETFTDTQQIDLPNTNDNTNISVRSLNRTVDNSSQLSASLYMKPNTPIIDGNEQIDTSVKPADDHVPITYNEQNIMSMKKQMIDANYEEQRAYQKQVYQLVGEIDRLRREIESLREQLINEKSHFEDMDNSMEDKHKQIVQANQLNVALTQKITELEKKNTDIENLYLQADSQKNIMEVRLRNIRDSMQQDIKHKGYTYLPPIYWTMNQWRPPNCLTDKHDTTCPAIINKSASDYATVYNDSTVSTIDTIRHDVMSIDPIDFHQK